ncbi:HAD family hydrolase [Rubinisphaera margarita]|uniref:HAD family hydrolase n=1 Tax=Rubinisphaera margarita TaxID=2909586 RepID=UPI001EE816F1|nr:HAD hydrolase family protein [Rubinisphaera margarita]MCG6155755.1 HAD hydrolase family protein [Rubinisphaera margarita]
MHFQVLATDYDGTIAHDSRVDEATLQSLRQLKESGRKLVLVSGRQLESLQGDFAHLDLFDLAVLENGALLFDPATGVETTLAAPPPPEYVARLRERGLRNLAPGRVIIAGRVPDHEIMFETIHELNL